MDDSNYHINDKYLLWLLALVCGVTAGESYFCQPIITVIQEYFQCTLREAQTTITLSQISYALGLLILVPLGDLFNRIKYIPTLLFLSAGGLVICGLVSNIYLFWLGTIIACFFSVVAHVILPFSTFLVDKKNIGKTVGFLMSGLLLGILVSTALSGFIANYSSWKIIYWIGAVVLIFSGYALNKKLSAIKVAQHPIKYKKIIHSMVEIFLTEKRLLLRAGLGAFMFASMSMVFSTMSIYLSASPFELNLKSIGLITLVGAFGAISSKFIGQAADKGYGRLLTYIGISLAFLSWISLYLSTNQHLILYILGFMLLNLGLAFCHSCNQEVVYKLRPNARSRINSIYMTIYFGGASVGSFISTYTWQLGYWTLTCFVGISCVGVAFVLAILDQRSIRIEISE